ncbi:MAG TPA: helix-turn-helix domain-containing protein [Pyrinomonadaceae bacterium]|nr:helix-turn-helix domain-containing protein [Pyrinomonadaceae bacterium]
MEIYTKQDIDQKLDELRSELLSQLPNQEAFVTAKVAEQQTGIKASTLYYWASIGRIKSYGTGRCRRFKVSEIMEAK